MAARFVMTGLFDIPLYVYFLLKLAKLSTIEFVSASVPSLIAASGVAVAVGVVATSQWLSGLNPVALLAIEVSVGGFIGIFALLSVDKQFRGLAVNVMEMLVRRAW